MYNVVPQFYNKNKDKGFNKVKIIEFQNLKSQDNSQLNKSHEDN